MTRDPGVRDCVVRCALHSAPRRSMHNNIAPDSSAGEQHSTAVNRCVDDRSLSAVDWSTDQGGWGPSDAGWRVNRDGGWWESDSGQRVTDGG